MTPEDIIRMAREAGFSVRHIAEPPTPYAHVAGHGDVLERFAALVAAAEREACAQVCDFAINSPYVSQIAVAIRARGEE